MPASDEPLRASRPSSTESFTQSCATRPPGPRPLTLRARSPEDLLAFVPLALGFRPERSLVVLTTGPGAFHARIDLPDRPADAAEVVDAVLAPAVRLAVRRVVLVLYGDRGPALSATARTAEHAFAAAGIEVLEVLRVHEGRWWAVRGSTGVDVGPGAPLDLDVHRFTAESVLAGHVVRGSRAELAAALAPRPAATAPVEQALVGATPASPAWVRRTVRRHVRAGSRPRPAEVARLVLALESGEARTAACGWMRRPDAARSVELWVDVVGRTPAGLVAGPASMLAVAAWVSGQGALAWCAVDRCRGEAPEHPLASLVAELLQRAVPPTAWEAVRARLPDPAPTPARGPSGRTCPGASPEP